MRGGEKADRLRRNGSTNLTGLTENSFSRIQGGHFPRRQKGMGNFLRIPGETPLPLPRPPRSHPDFSGLAAVVLFSVFCAGAYTAVKYWRSLSPHSDKAA